MISTKKINPISKVKIPHVSNDMLWEFLGCERPPVISSAGRVGALCSLQKLLEGGEGVSGARQLRHFQAGFRVVCHVLFKTLAALQPLFVHLVLVRLKSTAMGSFSFIIYIPPETMNVTSSEMFS